MGVKTCYDLIATAQFLSEWNGLQRGQKVLLAQAIFKDSFAHPFTLTHIQTLTR